MTAIRDPLSLLCELTYRCNLQCPYCYNPLDLGSVRDELPLQTWLRVIDEAAGLGIVQVGFSGGEPTLRGDDLVALIARATSHGAYTNLITQGTFLDEELLIASLEAGLAHVQISFQAPEPVLAASIAGTDVFDRKLDALRRVARRDVALTLNYVLHRLNHHTLAEVIDFAEREGIRRLELANVQFYGWAYRNRAALLPTREQVAAGAEIVAAAKARLGARMDITYVLPDYFEDFPKPCMHGWGAVALTVTPDGRMLPCPAAAIVPNLAFPNVAEQSLAHAWRTSPAFNAYRGTAWMPEPCRSCDRREIDHGGCRCQAFLLAGDAGLTDPACVKSPDHAAIVALRDAEPESGFAPRRPEPAIRR